MSLRDHLKRLFARSSQEHAAPARSATPDTHAAQTTTEPAGRRAGFERHPQLLSAGTSFGLRLHRQLAGERPLGNVVVCPVSFGLTLAMAANGARAQTRDSIARVLGIENMGAQEWNEGYAEILGALRIRGENVELRLSNSIWVDDAYPIHPEFASACRQYYEAELLNISFRSADAALRINRWVSEQTAGKIPRIVASTQDQMLLLLNAAYFLGRWARPFDPEETREGIFHTASGPRQHPMMHQRGFYDYLETDSFQAVALPYDIRGMALYLFLPRSHVSLSRFLDEINVAKWKEWKRGFGDRPGEIVIPRFRVECDLELTGALRALGMTEPFEPDRADFSGMFLTPSGVFVTSFRQKTLLDVNEKGTEAAAATAMAPGAAAEPPPPFRMVVDRPFFLAIRDWASGLLLFTASVVEP